MALTAADAFLPVPSHASDVAPWYTTVQRLNTENRCWRCGLTEHELLELGRDTDRWTLHYPVQGEPMRAQSCCRETADLMEDAINTYFPLICRLT